ncbi:TetR/AcrR family transcriptional regulator [Leifsonia sp. 21MFCrub1.1]|uniref:TetR/AcrR family transcriptional regulator n=1 Tax=Leifsonia sp. 21MFCrub1.1 TaxID=1798223 RepID=UPI000892923F|nr:helix-turn-helix domain-containing protein [Leifsonia sp. 21MFCrub1.1]SEA32382.1 regulatory protein, tetR family [Leifsonia sp. 21MFCrub1.1]
MGRWEPDARGRLGRAALELYLDPGYEQTTVADIAARAGVTERTFFRHFADKREVLFAGSAAFQETVLDAIAAQPDGPTAFAVAAAGMDAAAAFIAGNPDPTFARRRAAVIAANASLQERELLKLATVASASATALAARGFQPEEAAIAAEAAMAAFRLAFERWIASDGGLDLRELLAEGVARFRSLA